MADPIRIKIDTSGLERDLVLAQRQIPYAAAAAVNDLAFQAMRAENAAMSTVFAHPRPFTQHATQVERRATKTSPTATVSLRPVQAQYLAPYEAGGMHVLPGAALLVPEGIKLDQYGQIPKGAIAKLRANPRVFVGTVRGITGFWLRPVVGQRRGGAGRGTKGALQDLGGGKSALTLLIRFANNRPVDKHLNFVERAIDLVTARGSAAMTAAVSKALASMK